MADWFASKPAPPRRFLWPYGISNSSPVQPDLSVHPTSSRGLCLCSLSGARSNAPRTDAVVPALRQRFRRALKKGIQRASVPARGEGDSSLTLRMTKWGSTADQGENIECFT